MHEAATPAPPEASFLEEKGGSIATEVSPLSFETCHALYTFSPLIKYQHRNTAEDQTKTSQQRLEATRYLQNPSRGAVLGSQASIKGTTNVPSAELAHRLGVAGMLVTGTRADTCGTMHHRGPGGGGHSGQGHTHWKFRSTFRRIVPEKTSPPQECLTAFARFAPTTFSEKKKKGGKQKKDRMCRESVSLWLLCPR
jgi:hypothetical protein